MNARNQGLSTFIKALGLCAVLTGSPVYAGWENVGPANFSAGGASCTSLALDSSNTPYVAYYDWANGNKATVMKYDGSSWVTVGTAGFSAGGADYVNLVLDRNDTPYVAYLDVANSDKATVMKYDGSSWITVGMAGFSADWAYYPSLALDSSDTPYVSYADWANSGKATVMKFDGSSWVTVGGAGFSVDVIDSTSLALDSSDMPYVVYEDGANGNKATVMKFDGSSWVTVGTAWFSAGGTDYVNLAFDRSDTPYVAYLDWANNGKATVMKFDGTSWVTVGTAGFSAGMADYVSLALDSSDMPYVAYQDQGNSDKTTVMKFDGSSWVTVGTAGFSAGQANDTSLALDSNNTPYVAYTDWGNTDKATVMRFMPNLTLQTVGTGTVSSSGTPAGTSCGANCLTYPNTTAVTLTATPGAGFGPASWSCTPAFTSGEMLTADTTCTAQFDKTPVVTPPVSTGTPATLLDPTYSFTIRPSGKGTIGYQMADITGKTIGSVTECSQPEGCTYTLPTAKWIKLTGIASNGYEFSGFAGNTGDCSDGLVFLLKDTTCTAYFDINTALHVTFSISKSGGGTIKTGDGKINCGNICSASDYNKNAPVGLIAIPDEGSELVGFAGDPDCEDGLLTLDKPKSCSAVFRVKPTTSPTSPTTNPTTDTPTTDTPTINHPVNIKMTGNGKVKSTPMGIDCGTVCTATFPEGQHINLIATPGENSKFQGFVGDPACTEGHFDAKSTIHCEAQFVAIPKTETGTAKFAVSNFERPEGAHTLNITVKRVGGKAGELKVTYQTQDGTALAGKEYTAAQGTLTWADGDVADKTITIELLDETMIEADELEIQEEIFHVLLTAADGTPLDKTEVSLLETHHVQPHPLPGHVETPTIKAQPILPVPEGTTTDNTQSTNGETCLPKDNKLNVPCNANWAILTDFQIQEKGHLSAANITGKLTIHNTGWAANIKLKGKGSIKGGILTGYITCEDNNVLTDIMEFKGAVLKGCTLEGSILNTSRLEGKGLIRDVKLGAKAKVKGGRVGGKIEGDAKSPATLDWLEIDQGSELSNVILGKHVSIAPGVKLDDSVEFESSSD